MNAKAATLLAALACPLALSCKKPRDESITKDTKPPIIVLAPAPAPVAAPSGSTTPPSGKLREITFEYAGTPVGANTVVIAIPVEATKDSPMPVLVALHGRGESLKNHSRGARGWIDDYGLRQATERLAGAPLGAADYLGSVAPERLANTNQALAAEPYRGLIVVCPYLPDILHGDQTMEDGARYAAFIVDDVLPRVFRETPAIGTPETTAVDGVSLGGRAALLVGLLRPKAFRAVAALQPALDSAEARAFAGLAEKARKENPALALRLLSSSEDYFLESTVALSRELKSRNVIHHIDIVIGTHSYEFNRGPGVYEMLVYHDRVLRGLEPI